MKSIDMKCIEHYNILWRFQGPYIINENGNYLYNYEGVALFATDLGWLSRTDRKTSSTPEFTFESKFKQTPWLYQNNYIVSLIDQKVVTTECPDRGSIRECSTNMDISTKDTSNEDIDQQFFLEYQGRPNK